MLFVFLFLTYSTQCDNLPFRPVAANGKLSFFFMTKSYSIARHMLHFWSISCIHLLFFVPNDPAFVWVLLKEFNVICFQENLPSSPSFVLMSEVSIPNCQSDLLKIFQQLCMSTWWPRMATSHESILSNTLGCQFSSVAQSHSTLCNPMDCSTPGFPVHHQLTEHAQTHVHQVGDAIQPLILCFPLLLLPSVFPRIRVFSNESAFWTRWPKCWNFSFSISTSNEYSGLISFRIDGFHPLAVQRTLKSPF